MEAADVMLARHYHSAVTISSGVHCRLAALAGLEVLLVDPMERLDRSAHVQPRLDHTRHVSPIAFHYGVIGGHGKHSLHDHVIRQKVNEHLGASGRLG